MLTVKGIRPTVKVTPMLKDTFMVKAPILMALMSLEELRALTPMCTPQLELREMSEFKDLLVLPVPHMFMKLWLKMESFSRMRNGSPMTVESGPRRREDSLDT